jgi:hypothetical protein
MTTSLQSDLRLWEILVPCQWNDGKPIRTRHHREWDKVVRKITGGLTLYKPAIGQWIDPTTKTLYDERMIPVRIAASEKQITQIANFTLQHYRQIQVMCYVVSEKVIFFKQDNDKD